MIRINLLPVRAAQKKERIRSQLSVLVLSLVAVSIGCGAVYYRTMVKIGAKNAEVASVQSQISQLQKKIGEVSKYKKLQEDLKKKLGILQVLKEGRSGPVHLLDELNKVLPDKVWLTEFSVKSGGVDISGMAVDEKAVAGFMEGLERSPYYGNVELKEISQSVAKGIKLQKFSLTCKATQPAK